MHARYDNDAVPLNAIVETVRKAVQEIATRIAVDDWVRLRVIQDGCNSGVHSTYELSTKADAPGFIPLMGSLNIGVSRRHEPGTSHSESPYSRRLTSFQEIILVPP